MEKDLSSLPPVHRGVTSRNLKGVCFALEALNGLATVYFFYYLYFYTEKQFHFHALQNLLLAAHALGLGAIWRTGGMVASPAIREHLGFAPTDRIAGIVYVGRPAMEPPTALPRDVDAHLTILD